MMAWMNSGCFLLSVFSHTILGPMGLWNQFSKEYLQGDPKKISVFYLAKICSRCSILLSHMCFGIRILSLIHLTTLTIPIQNQKFPKTQKTHAMTTIFPLPCEMQLILCRLRNSACVCSWCFTYHPTLFSESKNANPQWVTWSSFKDICDVKHSWTLFPKGSLFRTFVMVGKMLSLHVFFAFLGHFWFWIGIVRVVRWIRLKILILKHMRESKIEHLE